MFPLPSDVPVEAAIPKPPAAAPTPGSASMLDASGYVVARRKAVVSSKIQGRLAELRVEEGSRVREGQVIARLESSDYEAQVRRGAAMVQRAEADLGEQQRQLRLAGVEVEHFLVGRERVVHLGVFFQSGALHKIDQGIGFARVRWLKSELSEMHRRQRWLRNNIQPLTNRQSFRPPGLENSILASSLLLFGRKACFVPSQSLRRAPAVCCN